MLQTAVILVVGLCCSLSKTSRLRASSPACDCRHDLLYCSTFHFGDNFNYNVEPKSSGNQLISPLSLYHALFVLNEAARRSTRMKLNTVMFPLERNNCNPLKEIRRDYQDFITKLKPKVVNFATQLFIAKGTNLNMNFSSTIQKFYKSGVQYVNFGKPKKTAERINKFVAKNTNNKIKDIIAPGAIRRDMVLVFVNAIHFKDQWEIPFKRVGKGQFTLSNGKSKNVEMMTVLGKFGYRKTKANEVVMLKFNTEGYSMVFMLPGDVDQSDRDIYDLLDTRLLRETTMEVKIPLFKIEATHNNLLQVLKKMGIGLDGDIDLTGMTDYRGVRISSIVQKTYIDLNEKGVEAAAATAGIMTRSSLYATEVFVANKPFRFYLLFHDVVVFQGRVGDPTAK